MAWRVGHDSSAQTLRPPPGPSPAQSELQTRHIWISAHIKYPWTYTPVACIPKLLCLSSAAHVHSITVREAVGGVQEGAAQAVHDEVLRVEQVCIRSLPLLPRRRKEA